MVEVIARFAWKVIGAGGGRGRDGGKKRKEEGDRGTEKERERREESYIDTEISKRRGIA